MRGQDLDSLLTWGLARKSKVVILKREIDTPMHTVSCLGVLS